jgi:hypothetical protein
VCSHRARPPPTAWSPVRGSSSGRGTRSSSPRDIAARKFSPADDFDVYRIRAKQPPDAPLLVGIYAGFAPDFPGGSDGADLDRQWTGRPVPFATPTGRWEFLIEDAAPDSKRGVLHIWFGPGADADSRVAERLVRSVQPASDAPADAPGPPPATDRRCRPTVRSAKSRDRRDDGRLSSGAHAMGRRVRLSSRSLAFLVVAALAAASHARAQIVFEPPRVLGRRRDVHRSRRR